MRKDLAVIMKKSIISLLLVLCLCLSVVLLSSCAKITDLKNSLKNEEPAQGAPDITKKGESEFTQSTEEGSVLPRNDETTNQIIDGSRRS